VISKKMKRENQFIDDEFVLDREVYIKMIFAKTYVMKQQQGGKEKKIIREKELYCDFCFSSKMSR